MTLQKNLARLVLSFVLLAASVEAAQPKNGYELGCGIGYRNDQMFFSMSRDGSLFYKEHDRNLRSIVFDGFLDLKLYGFLFSSYADVGWFVSGRTHDVCMMGVGGWPSYRSSFNQNVGGFLADGKQYAGAIFDFTNRHGGFKIIPEIGYGVFYQDIDRKTNEPESRSIPDQAILSCDLSRYHLQRQWWGPLVGGRLVYQLLHAWEFEGGYYYYYYLQLKQKFGFEQHLIYLAPGPSMVSGFFAKSQNEADFRSLHGQSFCGKIKAQVADSWKMNWRWDIYRFASKKKTTNKMEIRQVYPIFETTSDKRKNLLQTSWSAFSSMFEVEYFF